MAGSYKLPNNVFVNPTQKENGYIKDYTSQYLDPISTVKESYRQSLFSVERTEVNERLAEVLAVDFAVKLPSDLDFFGIRDVATQYGNRDWVSVICRVSDYHSGVPEPEQHIIDNTTVRPFKDMTRLRSNVGKFYAPMDDLRGKGAMNIEVGDWLVVEFQDKITMSNGIIKSIYMKKNVSTWSAASGGGAIGAFAGAYPLGGGAASVDNPSVAQEFWTMLAITIAEGGLLDDRDYQGGADIAQVTYNRYGYANRPDRPLNYGGKSIVAMKVATSQYEPTFCNKADWTRIVDLNSAIYALTNRGKGNGPGKDPPPAGYCSYPNRNVSPETFTERLEKMYLVLADPAKQAAAAAFVGGLDQFRDDVRNAPSASSRYGNKERSPKNKHNFFLTQRSEFASAPAQPIPPHIAPYLNTTLYPTLAEVAAALASGAPAPAQGRLLYGSPTSPTSPTTAPATGPNLGQSDSATGEEITSPFPTSTP